LASTPAQIECGWNFSSVLTKSGDVLVYWPLQGVIRAVYDEKMSEFDDDTSTKAHAQGNMIPCFTWDLQINPMLLPPLPRLPDLRGTGLDEATRTQETKLIKIACMESSLVGLTNKGHVLIFKGLSGIDFAGSSEWQYVNLFLHWADTTAENKIIYFSYLCSVRLTR
jgi:SCF-associated factor 1